MSLQKQITLTLLLVIALFAGLDHAVQRFIVFPRYREIDRANAEREMRRSLLTLAREVQDLDHLGLDWATREDLVTILDAGPAETGKTAQLQAELALSRLDFCYLLDRKGNLVQRVLPEGGPAAGAALAILNTYGTLAKAGELGSPPDTAGLCRTDQGVVMVAVHPVVSLARGGERVGTCLLGRLVDRAHLQALAEQTGVMLEFPDGDCPEPQSHPAPAVKSAGILTGSAKLSAAELAMLAVPKSKYPVLVRKQEGDQLECLACVPAAIGRHPVLLRGVIPMPITAMGRDVLNGSLLSLITVGLLLVIVLREAIKLSILKPLNLLTEHAVSLRSSEGHLNQISVVMGSRNELGVLAREFDSMVERLARARRQLVEQSYYSGMTEVASRVMHSLRNALTPITAHLDLLREEFRDLPVEQMKMAAQELSGQDVTPDRREMLARYLRDSVDYMAGVLLDAAVRLKGMDTAVAVIEKILAEQEKFAGRDRRSESVNLDALLREAGSLLSLNYYSGLQLVLDPSLAEVGPVTGRRHGLLHIFTNLISNAIEAILQSGRNDGRIEVRAEIAEATYPGMVHVTITDNGSGIAQEKLGRIFERGYTTKEHDSTGIGLHWCANTIATMHGQLFAESSGPGGGAVLHLLIPRESVTRKDTFKS